MSSRTLKTMEEDYRELRKVICAGWAATVCFFGIGFFFAMFDDVFLTAAEVAALAGSVAIEVFTVRQCRVAYDLAKDIKSHRELEEK